METGQKKSSVWLWAIVLIVIVVVVVTGLSRNKASNETIKIGGAYILSGSQALVGDLQKQASLIAIEEINAAGGINGRKLELVMEDSAYDSKKSLDAYNALKLAGINYIVADGSPVVAAIRPAAVKDGKVMLVPGATTPAYFDGSNLSCRIALTAKSFGPGYVQLLAKKNYTKVVTFLPDNEYGRGIYTEFSKAFEAQGGKILVSEFYNAAGNGDYRTNITKLKTVQNEAQAMVVVQVANTVEPMLKQISELGWKKPLVSDYYTIQNPALKNISLAEGIDYIDYEYTSDVASNDSSRAKSFKEKYVAKYTAKPVYLAASHYEMVTLLAEAIGKVGDDPQKVADYISNLKGYKGITGTLSFNNDCEVERPAVFRTVKDGKYVDLQ